LAPRKSKSKSLVTYCVDVQDSTKQNRFTLDTMTVQKAAKTHLFD